MEEWVESRSTTAKAMHKIFQGALNKAFNRWMTYVEEKTEMQAIMRTVAAKLIMREVSMAFNNWLDWWQDMCTQRERLRKAVGRIKNSALFGLWCYWVEVTDAARRAREALIRFSHRNLSNAFLTWIELCESVKAARDDRDRARRAQEWAPDAWLINPDLTYGGEGAGRQFLGVVEIGQEDLGLGGETVDWDVSGLGERMDWDATGRNILSPLSEAESGDSLDASELLRQRMSTMNAMFDQVEELTLDLEREMLQPTDVSRTTSNLQRTRRVTGTMRNSTRKFPRPHDGRWPAPVKE
eukprot:TRINITY_DN15447_c0_g1_i1.p1 TRINITY_DN15447_c0_g1~~TRINITY_DN15447_c0_g1_i1.p1  ORF type:complete len:297 (+),score=67.39 TRINITY_DN15447_c0_g1_i1:404-1294(+)